MKKSAEFSLSAERSPHCIINTCVLPRLRKLRRLRLAENRLTELDDQIGWLSKLQALDVSDNDLRRLPPCLPCMDTLTSFNCRGNHHLNRHLVADTQDTGGMYVRGNHHLNQHPITDTQDTGSMYVRDNHYFNPHPITDTVDTGGMYVRDNHHFNPHPNTDTKDTGGVYVRSEEC